MCYRPKKINEVVMQTKSLIDQQGNSCHIQSQSQSQSQAQNGPANSFIDAVFVTLEGAYKSSWSLVFKTKDDIDKAKAAWGIAFQESGLSVKQLSLGGAVVRRDTGNYPPTPGKYIHWCIREMFKGSLERFQNRHRVTDEKGVWYTNHAEYICARRVGYDCSQRLSAKDSEALWYRTIYEVQVQINRGEIDIQDNAPKIETSEKQNERLTEEQRLAKLDHLIKEFHDEGKHHLMRGPLRVRAKQLGYLE